MYSKKLIYDYIIGNDIDNLEKLESDNSFLFEVLKASHDISYYSYLDKSFRRTYDVIKYMLLNFKDNLDIYREDADYLLDRLDRNSLEYKEIIVLMASIDKDAFNNYKIYRTGFYAEDRVEVGAVQNSDKELEELIGLGFEVVLSKYEDKPLILDYYATCFLYEMFYEDKIFEEIIHGNIKDKEKLNKIGNNKFLLDYIGNLDYYLREYLKEHLYLLDNLSKDLDLVKNNWDNYIKRINEQRVAIVYQVVDKFAEEYRGKFYFDIYAVLDKIIRKYHLEEVFELEEELQEFALKDNEYLKEKFTSDMDKLITELFREDVIFNDNSDYNNNNAKVIEFKKK